MYGARDVRAASTASSATGPLLDVVARDQYRRRLRDLDAMKAEADECNDIGRRESLEIERDQLLRQLEHGWRAGGREASPLERARINVRNSITGALKAIGRELRPLSRHLHNSIQTGVVCRYTPEHEVSWQL